MNLGRKIINVVCALSASGALAAPEEGHGPDQRGGFASDHIIVKLKAGLTPSFADGKVSLGEISVNTALADAHATGIESMNPKGGFKRPKLARRLGLDRYYRISLPKGTNTPQLATSLSLFRNTFDSVDVDALADVAGWPNNPTFYPNDWNYDNQGQDINQAYSQGPGTPGADIDAIRAWSVFPGRTASLPDDGVERRVLVAVVDTGISHHPELITPHAASGHRRLSLGYNAFTHQVDTSLDDETSTDWDWSHGTHVAGTIGGGVMDATGGFTSEVVGVNWFAELISVKVVDGSGGPQSVCADGLIWAADHAREVAGLPESVHLVVNMSLAWTTDNQQLHDAVTYLYQSGAVIAAASGNNNGNNVGWPARYKPEVIGVAATNNLDGWAWFSNYGPAVDLSAPGNYVYSTWRTPNSMPAVYTHYWAFGTSMATPHVVGLASLLWAYNPRLTRDQVKNILINTTEDITRPRQPGWPEMPGPDDYTGTGRINARFALAAANPCPVDFNQDGLLNDQDQLDFEQAYNSTVPREHRLATIVGLTPDQFAERLALAQQEGCVCAQDFNGDGDVATDADIDAFFDAWNSHKKPADLNMDGVFGPEDIQIFFKNLSGSCH